jgi:hypothetical protein
VKIASFQVTKLLFSDLLTYRLDPVTVYLEDLGPAALAAGENQGKVLIECFGKSWSARWGSLGKSTVSQYIQGSDADYLAGCLAPSLSSTRFSGRALCRMARIKITGRRRLSPLTTGYLTRETARTLYDAASDLGFVDSMDQAIAHCGELLTQLFGDEFWHEAANAQEPNPDYAYLCRVLLAVRDGLAIHDGSATAERNAELS